MNIRPLASKALKYGVAWNVIKLSFALGAVFGMLAMAILLTSAKALAMLTGVL